MIDSLTSQQIKAARLLAEGKTGKTAAERVDVCPNTLSTWKKNPAFREEIRCIVEEDHEVARTLFTHLVERSVTALWAELNNENIYLSKRHNVALGILKFLGVERVMGLMEPPKQAPIITPVWPRETPGQTDASAPHPPP